MLGEASIVDRVGARYGRLVVLDRLPSRDGRARWRCRCDCGQEKAVAGALLESGGTQSCGCLLRKFNGDSSHPLYGIWIGIKHRTNPAQAERYPRYAGRGIGMCAEWRNDFQRFVADVGERPPGMSIDRIDPNGDYCPGNVRWSTAWSQAQNRSLSTERVREILDKYEWMATNMAEGFGRLEIVMMIKSELLGHSERIRSDTTEDE